MKRKIKTLKTTVMASPPNTIQKERTAIDKNLFGIITNCERITGTTDVLLDRLFESTESKRDKRAFEILGSVLSTITGVPSASDHRQLLEQVRLMKLDSESISNIMEKQNTANAKILERFHMHQEEMDALRGGLKTLYQGLNLQGTASTKISIALQILSETIHVNTQLQEAITIAKEILAKSDFDLLHRQSISPKALGDITDKIYLQRRNSTPVFSRSEIDQYYRLKLAHSWAVAETYDIMTLLQIPIAVMSETHRAQVLDPHNQIHPDLSITAVNEGGNFFRYLSDTDYHNCIVTEGKKICQKRRIEILPAHGCSIRLRNCDVWATTVAHDITNTEIMILLPKESQAKISCDDGNTSTVTLPIRAIISLSMHCDLYSESFHISKISFRHLADHKSQTSDGVKFEVLVDMKALSTKIKLPLAEIDESEEENLENLIRNNKKINNDIKNQRAHSDSLWAAVTGGDYAVEQMLTWVAIATSLLMALFSLCLHLRAAIGQCIHPPKQHETSGMDEQRTRDREHIRDIMSRVMDVETELQLQSVRKPALEHQTEPLDC